MDPCLGTIGNQRICDGSEKVSARKSYDECDPNMHNAQHGAFWKNTDRDTFVSRRTDAWGQAAAVSAGQTFTFNDGTATTMPNGVLSNFIWSNAENAATPPARQYPAADADSIRARPRQMQSGRERSRRETASGSSTSLR
jgi:hypothetical protein